VVAQVFVGAALYLYNQVMHHSIVFLFMALCLR